MTYRNGRMLRSDMPKPFYITTTLPYVNADPHIGFALELVQADITARYKALCEYEVFFNTGTDEHGAKVLEKAREEGKDPKQYADEYALKFRRLKEPLGLLPGLHFIRTTDVHHRQAAQEFWRQCDASGDIYKKNYQVKYCVGCELEKTDSELKEGRCPLHSKLTLEIREEENYFFRLSKYQDRLLALYDSRPDFVVPAFRLNEVRSLIKDKGLEDFSISRLTKKMPWGVPVPDDATQVMYVWFDALVNYISAIGWPNDLVRFKKWWIDTSGVVQFAGKDQLRQQAVMWQAMLMSAGLPPSKQIVIHGFITSGGEKISKSLGNVIDPLALVKEYSTDALRFYLARHIHPFEDSDFTMEKFREAYNADLANGLGNLVSRIMKMASDANIRIHANQRMTANETGKFPEEYEQAFEHYNIQAATEQVMREVARLDRRIQDTEPFKLIKRDKVAGQKIISELVADLSHIAHLLLPIIPVTAEKIQTLIMTNKMPSQPLFPRRD